MTLEAFREALDLGVREELHKVMVLVLKFQGDLGVDQMPHLGVLVAFSLQDQSYCLFQEGHSRHLH